MPEVQESGRVVPEAFVCCGSATFSTTHRPDTFTCDGCSRLYGSLRGSGWVRRDAE